MEVENKVRKYLDVIKKENKKINAILEVRPESEILAEARELDKSGKKGRLYGYVFVIKANINAVGMTASCASKTLENYKSTYDATAVKRIKEEGGLIIGVANCDEFASGWSGETSAFGATENPRVAGAVAGGSSSGSAAAVAAGMCDVALGSDTGGSIRVPASFCGVVGVKPSYGAVSRHGLIDLSMSLDQIGPLAANVDDAAKVLDVIVGKDGNDTKTHETSGVKLSDPGKVVIGVVNIEGVDPRIQSKVDSMVESLIKEKDWSKKDVSIKYIDLAIETYHLLVWTEFFSATRRFDGRKYGKKIEEACGEEVLRRILGGREIARAEHAGRYYHKALGVKEIIKQEFEKCFASGIDCILMPTVPAFPWKIGAKVNIEDMYATDKLTIPANLAEVCSVSLPVGYVDEMLVGMQVVCGKGEEGKMMSIAREVEKIVA